ncbi:hypothetical protein K2173_002072 [Erythroxylum novogranatense]|uniref:HECT-type E3 ubiquitin transferase n=1 Tax=Erythroxylum novogranatense TaxID=1862640 RepID=A0AAV8SQC3_9ROSI|nr:hypothetical protein K2173_002072 [Erythroxylum novogranatense]
MDGPRKNQVSLRGASKREISRDALLERVSVERELRGYTRRASSAAVFVQRVWRSYIGRKNVALKLQNDWVTMVDRCDGSVMTATWISTSVLRPFLFFIWCLSVTCRKIRSGDVDCMGKCFKIVLESISSMDSRRNVCSLALGSLEERRLWTYQSEKLISLGAFVLSECHRSFPEGQDSVILTSLVIRILVVLTDPKAWNTVSNNSFKDAHVVVKDLVMFMGSRKSGLYASIRRYLENLEVSCCPQTNNVAGTDDKFLISASTITLALRPFQVTDFNFTGPDLVDSHSAVAQYCLFILTIPQLTQRLPSLLVPALKHKSILSPCFQTLLTLRDNILTDMSEVDQLKIQQSSKLIPPVGWALANIICLATGSENEFVNPRPDQGLDYAFYVRVVVTLAEKLLACLDRSWCKNIYPFVSRDHSSEIAEGFCETGEMCSLNMSYLDLLKPVCQQWHLRKLLSISKVDACTQGDGAVALENLKILRKVELLDIAYFYSYMLRIFSTFNPAVGSLAVLNVLSFTPGFVNSIWETLESLLFPVNGHLSKNSQFCIKKVTDDKRQDILNKKQKHSNKDGANKWVNVLHKITGKSQAEIDGSLMGCESSKQDGEDNPDVWDVNSVNFGVQRIPKDLSCLLHLFCATYSHLLLVLDDIDFYEKQVPFTLERQRRIASVLNTLVYNGLAHSIGQNEGPLMDSAIRCLHLMYERDCRHQFCPPVLWLSPARNSRPPIAVAARTHEIMVGNVKLDDASSVPSMDSVITVTPHVYPFEERVQMFREFINMDKVSRKMAGEVTGPGSRAVEIVVRRDHIVEDGFQQLNSLGSRLKSSIHVSFVSECGLQEAGLDYGGLSKEFLTDLSKAAFSPEYGLFTQTPTSDRLLIPNSTARYLENGVQMIEFLGRVVGKALYEGILLDYAFSHVFVQKLLGRYSFLDELSTLDPELYRNLMYVKHYDGDIKDLSLDFTLTEEAFGKWHVVELKLGGKDVCVTNENKMQYIHGMADYKLNHQILPFSNAFYRGLTDLVSPSWLKLFNASEFNQLLSGGDIDIDVDDLRNNTRYTGGYSEGSRTIKLFWEVIKGFKPRERCMLLKFVTSCSRGPLLGFKHLQPSFTVHKVTCDASLWATIGGQDVERLPSASTCYNTLKLPTYKRASTLRAKLLYAISSNTGFELS